MQRFIHECFNWVRVCAAEHVRTEGFAVGSADRSNEVIRTMFVSGGGASALADRRLVYCITARTSVLMAPAAEVDMGCSTRG